MADFEKAFLVTLGHEGGYSHDPHDPGRETIYGISRVHHPSWPGWALVDEFKKDKGHFPANALSNPVIKTLRNELYKKTYWDIHFLDQVARQEIAAEIFDTGVNLGAGKAASLLILALNILNRENLDYADVAEDGKIDVSDIALLNAHKRPHNVLRALNGLQFMHYYAITRKNPKFEKYFNGWLNRV